MTVIRNIKRNLQPEPEKSFSKNSSLSTLPEREGALKIKPYAPEYRSGCLFVFMENVPGFFAPNEKDDFTQFLDSAPGGYNVVICQDKVVGSFGVIEIVPQKSGRISWIMAVPYYHGKGMGKLMVQNCLKTAVEHQLKSLDIAASYLSCRFFSSFGAKEIGYIKDGWGPGMHRVDMVLDLDKANTPKPQHP